MVNVLVIDVGGTNIKILATGQKQSRKFPSGITLTAQQMVKEVKKLAGGWNYVLGIETARRLDLVVATRTRRLCIPRC